MEVLLESEKIRSVLPRWERQYPAPNEITDKLHALDWSKATAADVEAVIGNESWTKELCGECSEYAIPVVRFGKYGDSEWVLCAPCIGKAAVLAQAFSKLRA